VRHARPIENPADHVDIVHRPARASAAVAILAGMPANALRMWLIGVLALAAVVSVVGNKTHSAFIGWVSFAIFLCAIALYVAWRRRALQERRARVVFDPEAKTDETRTRPDQ
jgi:uncharacterized membrane protein YfcA